jgi:hypothetical protein
MKLIEAFSGLDGHRFITKHSNYFDIYDEIFEKLKDKKTINLLEIGLLDGGSIDLWKKYFGDKLNFYGIDINPRCKDFEAEKVKIFIGSQSDRTFLKSVVQAIPDLDVIIDDGGHTMKQQKNSFTVLYPKLHSTGIYICEDTHTSYRMPYGGGYQREDSFIEFSKNMIDQLHHVELKNENINPTIANSLHAIHYYDSVVIFEKKEYAKREVISKGNYSGLNADFADVKRNNFYYILHKYVNKTLSLIGMKGYSYVFGPNKD